MSELARVDLRRPDGNVLVSWRVPLGGSVHYCPPLGCAPQGLVQVWCDSGRGYNQLGGSFVFTGDITICPPPPTELVGIYMFPT